MPNVNVTYAEMSGAATKLNAGKDSINEQLNSLKSFIDGLVTSGFVTDKASVKFNETYTTFTTSATNTINALTSLAQYLNDAAITMEQTDADLAGRISM